MFFTIHKKILSKVKLISGLLTQLILLTDEFFRCLHQSDWDQANVILLTD
jgi:hypothetical protein